MNYQEAYQEMYRPLWDEIERSQNQTLEYLNKTLTTLKEIKSQFKLCGVKNCEEYSVTEQELDVTGNLTPLCEQHLIAYEKHWELDVEQNEN